MTATPDTASGTPRRHGWDSRSVGSRLQHGSFYLLIRLVGKPPAYVLLALVVCWYVCYPSTRRKCSHYLKRRFPERRGFFRQFVDSYRMVFSLGQVLIDRAALGLLGPDSLAVSFPDGKRLLDLLAENKGLVLLGAHVGCWQVALAAFRHVPRQVHLVLVRDANDVDLHYFEHRGEAPPFNIIDPSKEFLGGVLSMHKALQRGEIVVLMGDRVFGGDRYQTAVDFLGQPALLPTSPYVLASGVNCPVAVLFSHKTGCNSYVLELAEVIRVPQGAGRKAAVMQPYARQFAIALERYVQCYPWQFMNFLDMWEPSPRDNPPSQ